MLLTRRQNKEPGVVSNSFNITAPECNTQAQALLSTISTLFTHSRYLTMPIPRTSSRTPLQEPLLPLHSPSEKPQPSLFMAQLAAILHPRKSRQRTTLLALLSLVLLTTYVFLVHCPDASASLALRRPEARPAPSQLTLALESIRNSGLATMSQSTERAAQIRLSSAQELAAVSSFLASLPQNQIPSFVDPSSPIDPQLVLDFDTRGPRASLEVQAMVDDVWSRNPVFLYSKVGASP